MLDQVTIIAADLACGLIVVCRLPSRGGKIPLGQQPCLDPCRQQQVLLQGALLGGLQAVQAKLGQRIGKQPLGFHRSLARFTHAIAAVLHAFQSAVHLFQQLQQVGGLRFGHRGFQLLPPHHQLVAQHVQVCYLDTHGRTPSATESFSGA